MGLGGDGMAHIGQVRSFRGLIYSLESISQIGLSTLREAGGGTVASSMSVSWAEAGRKGWGLRVGHLII